MKIQILFSFLVFFFVNANISPALAKESNLEVLKQVWPLGSQKSCTKEMQGAFNQLNFDDIVQRLNSSDDRTELARVLNPFLFSLGWSHTEFFPDSSESYFRWSYIHG